ncbi:SIR2 family NAD-dependent protein deacylase [Gordonia hirsuta]|uniref:SIR2 family NAD-dependent protein deacylase n=1 Tax=Gordonia hirsuta TaxID=53427 RepID=UPI000462D496|nr:NAD-dependent deacylase [Gordonia hirsuta]
MSSVPADLLAAVRAAERIVVFTGAGMSAESGLPTFRDEETGLWSRYDVSRLATPEAWDADPALVWAWYQRRRFQLAAVEPNPGHRAIAALGRHRRVDVVTQNVDDLHERGGSERVVHLHGRLAETFCDTCRLPYPVPAVDPQTEHLEPERCVCGGRIRPGVVWFGEHLPADEFARAVDHAENCDLMLVVGTSGIVYPAAGLPQVAREHGATVAEINPNRTDLSEAADLVWRAPASTALPALLEVLSGTAS